MKILKPRTILTTLLIIATFFALTGNVSAKHNSPFTEGWGPSVGAHGINIDIDPPKFSAHPIEGPEDIPIFRAKMRQYIQDLREYLDSVLDDLRP